MKKPFISRIFKSLEKQVGVKIVLEPKYGYAGQIILPNGQTRYFRSTHLDINPLGASEISHDKDYAAFFMKKLGYPVVTSFKFYTDKLCEVIKSKDDINAAYFKACDMGFPVILKPNDGSQGHGVTQVFTKDEFFRAAKSIFKKHDVMLVQKVATGKDYRIVVLDDEIISAYERIPLSVIGDGKHTIKQLVIIKQKDFIKNGRDTQIDLDDFRIIAKLKRQKLYLDSILNKDQQVFLLDNANLSSGGDAKDVTDIISRDFKKMAIKLTAKMNLRYCGVDLMTNDSIDSNNPKNFVILEINSAPGLDHYAYIGSKQNKIVRSLYKKVLEALKRD